MSLFCVNECKFNNCGLHFATMYELIQHIEETHIESDVDFTKKVSETAPSCIPISYLCRVFPKLPAEKAKPITPEPTILHTPIHYAKRRLSNVSTVGNNGINAISFLTSSQPQPAANRTVTSSGGFVDSSMGDSDNISVGEPDSFQFGNDSSTMHDDSSSVGSSPLGIKMMSSHSVSTEEKRYACPVQNCNKRYKNINGVRMHAKTAHSSMDAPAPLGPNRPYKCNYCNKAYKTNHGLQNHITVSHKQPAIGSALSFQQQQQSSNVVSLSGNQSSSSAHVNPVVSVTGGGFSSGAPSAAPSTSARNPPVTLVTSPPSKGTTTIHVSPAPSPAAAATVAGGHQYHQSPPFGSYHPSQHPRSTSGQSASHQHGSGSNVTFVPLTGRSPPVKKFTHIRHPHGRPSAGGQVHGFVVHNQAVTQQTTIPPNVLETVDVKSEK